MNLEDFTTHLDGVRPSGPDSVTAKCPAHEDRTPSLKVTNAGDRLLLHCYAGCSVGDILAALGLDWSALFEGDYQEAASRADFIRPTLRVEDRRRLVCRHYRALLIASMGGPAPPELHALREQYGDDEFDQIVGEFSDGYWLHYDKWRREWDREYRKRSK